MFNTIKRGIRPAAVLAMIALCLVIAACGEKTRVTGKKVLIFGFDGMDPRIVRKMMEEGKLPTLTAMAERGGFSELTSSLPPQSPVAWSNFITGQNPGKHGIFDFIHRDPKKYMPYLSTSEAKEPDPEGAIAIGRRVIWWKDFIPFTAKESPAKLLRHGKPFWEYLADDGISTRVFKIPSNFPPWEGKGWSSSGMGTPDMLGTYGNFTFFTDNPPEHPEEIGGGTIVLVQPINGAIRTWIDGPTNIFELDAREPYYTRKVEQDGKTVEKKVYNHAATRVPLNIYIDEENPSVKIEWQDQELLLSQGEWSEFKPLAFEMWPGMVEAKGIVRFYLKEVRPDFKLYMSPINMDPTDSPLPITSPPEYAQEIAADLGYYYTQGMPENTKARQADLGVLDDAELFHQMMLVFAEDMKIFPWHLDRFQDGLLFYYFSTSDLGAHMYWRYHDPKSASRRSAELEKMGNPIETVYKKFDHVLAMALEKAGPDTEVIVMSDHGFGPWNRSFQVNTWLMENGYLKLKAGVKPEEVEYFFAGSDWGVDWSLTSAYNLGLNGLYINLAEREEFGAVSPEEKKKLIDEIAAALEAYVDPETGERPVKKAYKAYESYDGPYADSLTGIAPDIIIGYYRGYRGGDESALGKFPASIITINESSWSGDHCVDTTEVPGVIFTSFKIAKSDPALIDVGPTVLKLFGMPVPEDMDGKPMF